MTPNGSSCFGTRDLTVVIEIECLQGRFPIGITVLGLRIWGGLSVALCRSSSFITQVSPTEALLCAASRARVIIPAEFESDQWSGRTRWGSVRFARH